MIAKSYDLVGKNKKQRKFIQTIAIIWILTTKVIKN